MCSLIFLFFLDFFFLVIFGGSHKELAKNERDPLGVRSAGTQKSVKARHLGGVAGLGGRKRAWSFGLVCLFSFFHFFCDSQSEWW